MPTFGKRQVTARVTGVAWSRVVQIEYLEWVAKRSSWEPGDDARNVQRHTEKYWAMETDMQPGTQMPGMPGMQQPGMPGMPGMQQPGMPDGSGFPGVSMPTTRSVRRARVFYTYEAPEWTEGRALRASGTDQDGVAWPEFSLEPHERVARREESYSATFTAGDKSYQATLPEEQWRALSPGGGCQLTLRLFGGVKKVTPAAA